MDVEKLIQAADFCDQYSGDCQGITERCQQATKFEGECEANCVGLLAYNTPEEICSVVLQIRDYYEALLKAERSKVIAEVREWTLNHAPMIYPTHLMRKLDSMVEKEENV